MSHKKVLQLAAKFAEKTVMFGQTQKIDVKREQVYHFFEQFKRHFRSLLSEMDGDFMTLRIKRLDRAALKEYYEIYKNLLELFKRVDDQNPLDSMQLIVSYVLAKNNRSRINSLDMIIQKFLKENEVDFSSQQGLSQARVESLKNLIKIITSAHSFLNSQASTTEEHAPLKNEGEEYAPVAGAQDKTKVGRNLSTRK